MDDLKIAYLNGIVSLSIAQARRAITKFPQPNYCLTKVAEEAGEVVKAGVHLAEGRDFTHDDLESEVVDTIAMLFRVLIEGDQVIGLPSTYAQRERSHNARGCVHCDGEFRVNIEGVSLCQHHANEWVRGEGMTDD